ncbi:MAG: response regulator transcription factor [Oscillospiraceae bacterium]|nr:response regulator transcription factor [Oscillospiraceae bacterium]
MIVRDKILVVEDELTISNLIRTILTANGYEVITAVKGSEALSMISSHCPELIVLDLGLPDMDGVELIRSVRSWTNLPIIVVSARSYDRDKVQALDLGADDYLTKPFSSAELLARVRVAIRHTRMGAPDSAHVHSGKFTAGNLTIDYDKHQVLVDGKNCHLTQNEYKIVALLARYAGRVLTYDFLLQELWGPQNQGGNQILRVNMANIRRKIEKNPAEPQYIFTEVGVGYRMVEGDS